MVFTLTKVNKSNNVPVAGILETGQLVGYPYFDPVNIDT